MANLLNSSGMSWRKKKDNDYTPFISSLKGVSQNKRWSYGNAIDSDGTESLDGIKTFGTLQSSGDRLSNAGLNNQVGLNLIRQEEQNAAIQRANEQAAKQAAANAKVLADMQKTAETATANSNYQNNVLNLGRTVGTSLRDATDAKTYGQVDADDSKNLRYFGNQNLLSKTFRSVLGNNTDVSNASYQSILDLYNNASGDAQADVKKALADEIVAQQKYAKQGNQESLQSIDYLNDLSSLLTAYGDNKGKSFGKQLGDWLSTGGFVGSIGGNNLTQALGNLAGAGDITSEQLQKQQNTRQDLGAIGALDTVGSIIGNTALNLGTGGWWGISNAALGAGNTLAGLGDKVMDYDDNNNAYARDKTALERVGEIGSSALDVGFAALGKAGVGPSLEAARSSVATGLPMLTGKDVLKYTAKELPWAAATTYAQTGLGNLASGKDWGDMNAEDFAKDFAMNVGQDVGMDIFNYGRQRSAIKNAILANDGSAVKVNADGTTTKLSDTELAEAIDDPTSRLADLSYGTTQGIKQLGENAIDYVNKHPLGLTAHRVGNEIELDGDGTKISDNADVKQIRKDIREELDSNYRNKNNIEMPDNSFANMNKQAVKKFVSGNDIDGLKRLAEMTDDISDLMSLSELIKSEADTKGKHAFAKEWEEYVARRVKLANGENYDLYTKVAVDSDGNRTLYSQETKKSSLGPVSEQSSYRTGAPNNSISQIVGNTTPFQTNSARVGDAGTNLNALAQQAEQGNTYAQKQLAKLTGQDQNEKTDWRGKSVDEVINPEEARLAAIEAMRGSVIDTNPQSTKLGLIEANTKTLEDFNSRVLPADRWGNKYTELVDMLRNYPALYDYLDSQGAIKHGLDFSSDAGNGGVESVDLQKLTPGQRQTILELVRDNGYDVNIVDENMVSPDQLNLLAQAGTIERGNGVNRIAIEVEPLGVAEDGTPEFINRYTEQTILKGVDNSKQARQSRMKQFMESLKSSDSPIVQKFYDLWNGKNRKNATIAQLTAEEARRYTAESGVLIADNARFVMTDNFVRHEDNDGHLTGIRKYAEAGTGYQIDANPLTKSDIAMLDSLVKNPDTITNVGNGRDGQRLKIEKQIGDRYRIIAEVVNDGKELNLVTLYKQNKTPIRGVLPASLDSGVPGTSGEVWTNSPRSETTTLSNIVSRGDKNVNSSGQNLTESANRNTARVYENESDALPADFDVAHYVTEQVEAQRKRNKLPLRERIADTTAELKHYLVDDAVAYERYIKDKNERLNIREGVDRVRTSDMQARQWILDHGLGEIGKLSDADMNEFQQYLIAKRALEVAEQGRATGRSKAADQALIDYVGNKYAKEEAIVRQYTRDMLEYSAENGLISQKLKNDLIKNNPNYVPLNRVFDTLESKTGFKSKQLGNLSKQSVVQKLKGSERVIENPIESLMLNTDRMINEVERNKTAKLIAQSETFHEKVLADGEKPRPGYDKLTYLVDGEKVSYEVPELVAKEMKNLNSVLPDSAEKFLKIAGAPTRWLRSGATQNNPLFAISNLSRDQAQTLVTGSLKNNVKGMPKALMATFGWGEDAKALRAELNRAGIIGSEYRQTYGYKPDNLVRQLQADAQIGKSVTDKLKHPINSIGDLIGRTEYFTRAQQYFGTDGDAVVKAQAARNNTLNFSRAGATVRVLNRVIPFLNASVQGGRATVNSFAKRPIHTALAMSSLAAVAFLARGAAEAQDKELWDRIDESDKSQNIIIFTPNAHYDSDTNRVEGIIKIPIAQMTYPIMDFVNNRKGDASDLLMMGSDIITVTTGLETPNEENGWLPVVNQLTPTFAKPILEAIINKSTYTGNDLVSKYDSNKNPEDKGAKYTTGLARSIASVTGIDAPIVDNFIQNWGGGLAKDLSKVLTDNPDNTKDGGGIGAMFESGFNRRFLSGTVESQYEIAEGLANNYKNAVKDIDAFGNLSSSDQQRVLNAIDNDMTSIASMAAKIEQGRNGELDEDSKLSRRQTEIVANGFNAENYIASVLDKSVDYEAGDNNDNDIESSTEADNSARGNGDATTLNGNLLDYGNTNKRNNPIKINDGLADVYKSILKQYNSTSSDDWKKFLYGETVESAAAEYNLALAKYQNDLANGDLTDVQKITRQKELAKLEASQNWTKEYRDAYSLASSKEDIQTYLNGLDSAKRAETVAILNGLNNAMYSAGIITASTHKTRSNAINNVSTSSGTSKYGGITSAEASAISGLAKTKAINTGSKAETPSAPTTKRKLASTGSGKSGLKNYSSASKTVTVSKNSKRSIA